jgi:hypothetical protein
LLLADAGQVLVSYELRKQLYVTAPLDWLLAAAHLPGKAAVVAIQLAFLSRVKKANPVRLGSSNRLRKYAERHALYRGVIALERGGLISVERAGGRSHLITLQFEQKFWDRSLLDALHEMAMQ